MVSAALGLALIFAIGAASEARSETWFTVGTQLLCMDLDSVSIKSDQRLNKTFVAYRTSICEQNRPTMEIYWLGVTRDDCPAALKNNTDTSYPLYIVTADDHTWREDVEGNMRDSGFRQLAFLGCSAKGEPDGIVAFENDMADSNLIVYIDGSEVCRLDSALGDALFPDTVCEVDLRRFGSDQERRHAVRLVAGRNTGNDTVSISDCHWNWQGTKVFQISDKKIHFDCKPVTSSKN